MAGGYAAYRRRVADEAATEGMRLSDALVEAWEIETAQQDHTTQRFMDWALRVPEPKSGTLDFRRFPFQRELYSFREEDPDVVIQKATQVGVSAYLARWTMYAADVLGLTALYVFPKQAQLFDFSDSRIRPLILNSPDLRSRVPAIHVQNKGLKQIGMGFVYYRGSESKEQLDSVDADWLALDEYDTLKQENVPDAERRITGSLQGRIRRVGVPSIPDWGINRLYNESDKRQWMVKCGACNEHQPITFWDNLDQDALKIVCAKCTKPLDVTKGQWVAEFPSRSMRGYHIPRLIVPHADLGKIVDASKAREPYKIAVHHNKDLGSPWVPEEGRLSKEALAAATREYVTEPGYVGSGLVTMGVDVASVRALNVRISVHNEDRRSKGALAIKEVQNFDELASLMDQYSVKMCAIDHLPEHRLARAFAERYSGRVYLVRYSGPQAAQVLAIDEELKTATVRRTEAIDAALTMIREQRNELPINRPDDYDRQMMSNVRFTEQDELGRMVVGYRATGPDDYCQAEVYDVVATELWWLRQQVTESQREVFQPLDDMLEFQRSALGGIDDADGDWSPGVGDDYSSGPGDDYDVS